MTVDLRIRSTVGNESAGFETVVRLVIGGNKDRWIGGKWTDRIKSEPSQSGSTEKGMRFKTCDRALAVDLRTRSMAGNESEGSQSEVAGRSMRLSFCDCDGAISTGPFDWRDRSTVRIRSEDHNRNLLCAPSDRSIANDCDAIDHKSFPLISDCDPLSLS